MVSAVDYVLEGLAKALEVERECGLRAVEIDRALLAGPSGGRTAAGAVRPAKAPARAPEASGTAYDFVFLHDRALSKGGVEMMAKIVTAMKKTPETAPVLFTGGMPEAKAYVVLGAEAMRKWFPGKRGAPGSWIKTTDGRDALVTYSPEFILRFGPATSTVKRIKGEMWTALKGVMQRVEVKDGC